MKMLPALIAATAVLLSGCAGDGDGPAEAAPAVPAATVTVTATATETVTVPAGPVGAGDVADLGDLGDLDELIDQLDEVPTPSRPPKLHLRVFEDGCGVIRSRPAPGTSYDNLTWTFLDRDGFQVLGRNAEGETRYRYFQGGTYSVVLEAFVAGAYRPVSNKVIVSC